ncbi:PREDICTED: protein OSB1, mitochondrial [Tarenaya hassleriana]|uniref:protein OSB1, mitochondrial n=1 Tax=Tarenaya hassleriana TaxID=28532 RepID=UPI00053C72AF|nr:PREDICTED: protein OSB1, mitochondrial [Tarenaya hassleriana]
MNTCRVGRLIRISAPNSAVRRFVPSAGVSAGNLRFSSFSDGTDAGSLAYRHARVFKKPISMKFRSGLFNSVSLVGFVDRPIRVLDTEPDRFGVFTLLRVKDPRDQNLSFRIFLHMWDGLAKKCIAHVKPNDLIYVSGRLVSHSMSGFYYQVKVNELNYVVPTSQDPDFQTSGESKPETDDGNSLDAAERTENRLYLWQVLFANPYEWWDNRRSKKNPRQPDFKHKDTGEALWLNPDDPPWVRRQLQLLDRRTAAKNVDGQQERHHSRLFEWIYDE